MHEARDLVVLDDLERIGASAGAGFGDIAQTLKLAYKRNSATKPVVDRSGSVAALSFFGPKYVTNTRGADDVLGSRMVRIVTGQMPQDFPRAATRGADGTRAQALRDELHCWGMSRCGDVHLAYGGVGARRTRRDEIEVLLRVIAGLIGAEFDRRLRIALERPIADRERLQPAERVRRALASTGAVGSVTVAQLQLELALAAPDGDAISSETIGRLLVSLGVRTAGGDATRVRLNGTLIRVVDLDGPAAPAGFGRPALDFCRASNCGSCRYTAVCGSVLPELRSGKKAT